MVIVGNHHGRYNIVQDPLSGQQFILVNEPHKLNAQQEGSRKV
jgi:hypothetical protein